MQKTKISWTDYSSNPIKVRTKEADENGKKKQGWACSKVSEGCQQCYAETINTRYGTKLLYNDASIQKIEFFLDRREIQAWQKLKEPSKIFVMDMSDLFHKDIPDEYRHEIFQGMAQAPRHSYQILTKRPERMRDYFQKFPNELLDCMWLGTSVESKKVMDRLGILYQIPARIHFASFEPLLESIKDGLNLSHLEWAIVGAESGNKRRAYDLAWPREIRDACLERKIPYYYKQGSHRFSGKFRELDGRMWEEFPLLEESH